MTADITERNLDLDPYAGRWVAVIKGRVVGQGGTPELAIQAAKNTRHKEVPRIMYVPTNKPLVFSPLLDRVRSALLPELDVYLVGGAVRDALLSRPVHDYDFALPGDALRVARKVANRIGAAYFPLDEDRKTARIIFSDDSGKRHVLDFAAFRGPDLESDLKDRDFTVNALAVDLRQPQEILDPLGGAADLLSKTLRACSPSSLADDPVRVLRAVRMAASLGLRILPETRNQMRAAVPKLAEVTPERLRDELIRILGGPKPHTSIQALDMLGALPHTLPELLELKALAQSPPHVKDVWGHTLDAVKHLAALLGVLGPEHDQDASSNLVSGLAVMRLGRFRSQISQHLQAEIIPERQLRPLVFLALLYHDIAKPLAQQVEVKGRIRFIDHAQLGKDVVARRAGALRLSNKEIGLLKSMVGNHMRPTYLAREEKGPSSRAVYRYFRDLGETGISVCLISLADLLATYGPTLHQARWSKQLDVCRTLMQAWWEQPGAKVRPPTLITGHDLMAAFDLQPGPQIGDLLEAVREAQVLGEIKTKAAALEFVGSQLKNQV